MARILTAKVNAQQIALTDRKPLNVAGTVGLYQLQITFDSEWDGLTKFVTFKSVNATKTVVYNSSAVDIPWEVITKPCLMEIGVIGIDEDTNVQITTAAIEGRNVVKIEMPTTADTNPSTLEPNPTPGVVEYYNNFNNLINRPKYNGEAMTGDTNITTGNAPIEKIKVNGTEQTITDKTVDISVPTKTSDLTNDSAYQTATDLQTALATKQDTLTTTSNISVNTLTTAGNVTVGGDETRLAGKLFVTGAVEALSGTVSVGDLRANSVDVENSISVPTPVGTTDATPKSYVDNSVSAVATDLDAVEAKIPAQATSSNQLADKDFVNSSIATNTANFKGTFNSISELPTTGVTNNDYAFVIGTDAQGNTQYNRYKYSSATSTWTFEYTLNNSSFTANQWATINSGATAENIAQIATNTTNIALKLDKTSVKTTTDTTTGNTYDVTYINSMIGNIETTLNAIRGVA